MSAPPTDKEIADKELDWLKLWLDMSPSDKSYIRTSGDVVLSPFAGIGSEGFVAVQRGRKFIGMELKASYWKQAVTNLELADAERDHDLL